MAQTLSTFLMPLGHAAPDFSLTDPRGHAYSLSDFSRARVLVVMFICNHCPFVKHIRSELAALWRDYHARGVEFVGINSNDIDKYPDDAPDKMAEEAASAGWGFPYLFDATQQVAKAYMASCTPDFFVFDDDRRLVYRGQLDDSRPPTKSGGNNLPVTGADLRAAIDAVLTFKPMPEKMRPSIGCNIKWKPGNEPGYTKMV